jgi:hypothetical protein
LAETLERVGDDREGRDHGPRTLYIIYINVDILILFHGFVNPKEGDHLGDLGVNEKIKVDLK